MVAAVPGQLIPKVLALTEDERVHVPCSRDINH